MPRGNPRCSGCRRGCWPGAHARAELEAVPLTTIVEELLAGYADGVPQEPSAVHDRLRAAGLKWQRR